MAYLENRITNAEDWGEEWYADYCHYTPAGFKRLAEHVAETIRSVCEKKI